MEFIENKVLITYRILDLVFEIKLKLTLCFLEKLMAPTEMRKSNGKTSKFTPTYKEQKLLPWLSLNVEEIEWVEVIRCEHDRPVRTKVRDGSVRIPRSDKHLLERSLVS